MKIGLIGMGRKTLEATFDFMSTSRKCCDDIQLSLPNLTDIVGETSKDTFQKVNKYTTKRGAQNLSMLVSLGGNKYVLKHSNSLIVEERKRRGYHCSGLAILEVKNSYTERLVGIVKSLNIK